ncbi:MAG: bifunctional 4-hydroxy-2-oxoglutarate aldolase/2-dehydro-3-deoxy-phosphogluconate aldolase [Eubacteriales bacterium]
MREQIIKKILSEKLIVIVRGVGKDRILPLADALSRGGVKLMEVTYDASGATPETETAEMISMLKEHFGDKMSIGSGTTLSERQVRMTKESGGEFIISPDTCRAVIEKTRELDMVSIPGALTPTEIADAHRFGADFVKLFPVSVYPPDYIKAVRAPLSHVRLLAVGGVNISNMEVYRDAGVLGFGLGHTNILRGLPEGADEAAFVELVSRYVSAAKGTGK